MAGFAVELKPQDLVVLYKQVAQAGQAWTYASLGEALGMCPSQVHRSVKRAVASGLVLEKSRGACETVRTTLHEFAVHGVRYAFPAVIGPLRRGIPTAFGVPPLSTALPAPQRRHWCSQARRARPNVPISWKTQRPWALL